MSRFNATAGVDWNVVVIIGWPGCSVGSYGPPAIGQSACTLCGAGKFASTVNATSCDLCAPGQFADLNGTSVCEFCPDGTYQIQYGKSGCNECQDYSSTVQAGSILCACDAGYYLPDTSNNTDGKCKPCPALADCQSKGLRPIPALNSIAGKSWRWINHDLPSAQAFLQPPTFYACPFPKACLSSNNGSCFVGSIDGIEYGFKGVLCGVCLDGYRLNVDGCIKCGSQTVLTVVLIIVLGLALFAMLVYIIRRVEAKYFLNSLQILVSFAQIVASTSLNYGSGYNWPPFMASAMSFARVALFDIFEGAAISCIIPYNFFTTYIFLVSAVFFAVAITFIIRVVVPLIWEKWYPDLYANSRKGLRDFCLKGFLLFMGLAYPTVSLKALSLWSCTTVGNKSWMTEDFSIQCYVGQWTIFSVFNAVFVAFFVVGWPAWLVFYLRKIHSEMEFGERKVAGEGKRRSTVSAQRIQRMETRAGNLYLKFKPGHMYWGVWETLRQLYLVAIVVFVGRGTLLQIILSCFISVAALCAHIAYRPFREPTLNVLQGVCLISTYVIFQAGVMIAGSNKDQGDDIWATALLNMVAGLSALLALAPFVVGVLFIYDVVPRQSWERAMLYLSCEKIHDEDYPDVDTTIPDGLATASRGSTAAVDSAAANPPGHSPTLQSHGSIELTDRDATSTLSASAEPQPSTYTSFPVNRTRALSYHDVDLRDASQAAAVLDDLRSRSDDPDP
jgi:hypothetical protein